jgi:predicted nucleic acid-binding protein
MSGRYFLDTNIFVYSFDSSDTAKRETALELIRKALQSGQGVVSYQVVQEFFHVALRKFKTPFDTRQSEIYLDSVFVPLLAVHSSIQLFERALELMPRLRISWYDSVIVAAAAESGCSVLYSEDLQHGRKVGGMEIRNPFISRGS